MIPVRFFMTFILFFVINLAYLPLQSQITVGYEVATWYQFKTSAITYTFDDNTKNQLSIVLPIFDQYNFKTTLFVIPIKISNWSGYVSAVNNGHEIASHTLTHPNLSTLTVENQDLELKNSQISIRANVTSAHCQTIAYPNCVIGDLNTIQKYYLAGRICNGVINPATPSDFYKISSTSTGTVSGLQTAQQLNDKVNLAKSSKGWYVFLTHAIDSETGCSPTSSSEIAAHLAYVSSNSSSFWVATFEHVVKYIKERNALAISENQINTDSYIVRVSDNLPDSVYNVPVTVKRMLPTTWIKANVYNNNKSVNSYITTEGKNKYIVFDVVPDSGDFLLTKSDETGIVPMNVHENLLIQPNPFSKNVQIKTSGSYNYSIFNLDGQLCEEGSDIAQKLIGMSLNTGVYILKVNLNNMTFNKKIIKL